jgi:Tfp pilus assembly protein PilX
MTGADTMSSTRRDRALAAFRGFLKHRLEQMDDAGQTIVIVVILLVLLAALAPVMAGQVTRDTPLLTSTTNKHAALAAAEAGIQWYRDNLDTYSAYFNYSATNLPSGGDAAMSGYCGAGQSSTCDLGGTTPPEAFHYVPDLTQGCATAVAGTACTVNVTVTGRAGTPGNYSYVYAEASFSASSVLNDAYFSNYEVLDPNSQTIQGYNVTTSPNGAAEPETSVNISYSYVNDAGTTVDVNNVSVWQAVCQYDTYSQNWFLDSLQPTIGGTAYSNTHPYYGPLQDPNYGLSFQVNGNGLVVSTGGTNTITLQPMPCASPYDFVDGEVFDGPVYSNDQIHVCGAPTFNGSPVSLTSGAPDDPYVWDVPGSVKIGTQYFPEGYTTDNVNCANNANPTLAHGVAIAGNQSLPSLNTQLAAYGTNSPPTGTLTGCTYTGPTMIELVTVASGTTKMDVWSPLSSAPSTSSTCSGGSSFSTTTPFITNIPLPADGVIYVQNYTLPNGATAPTVNDGSSPCFNPYQVDEPADSPQCLEGDAYVEGELQGQLTIASAANIIVTRDLTYTCVDGNGAASITNPDTVSKCATENNPDILGLSAKFDVLVAHNDPSDNVTQSTQDCASSSFGDGTGTPVNTPTTAMLSGNPYNGTPVSGVTLSSSSTTVTASGGGNNFGGIPVGTDVSVSGTDIAAGTTVADIGSGNNPTSLTLSQDPTGSKSNVTLTFTDPALANDPAAVWPTLCNTTGTSSGTNGIGVDAAVFALNGSFGVQNWNLTPFSNYVNLNGTDLSEYRGPFGTFGGGGGTSGYEKRISFDQRLDFLSPPFIIPGSVPLWVLDNYVECPNASCPAIG